MADFKLRHGWKLQAEVWRDLKNEAESLEWSRVKLEREYALQVPHSCGVYLICASIQDIPIRGRVMERLYNAVYAGQTTNLNRRFSQHVYGYGNVVLAKGIFGRLDFWYSEVMNEHLRAIEKLFIDTLGPAANVASIKAKVGNPVLVGSK